MRPVGQDHGSRPHRRPQVELDVSPARAVQADDGLDVLQVADLRLATRARCRVDRQKQRLAGWDGPADKVGHKSITTIIAAFAKNPLSLPCFESTPSTYSVLSKYVLPLVAKITGCKRGKCLEIPIQLLNSMFVYRQVLE